ncbi:MAG: hypothetical protein PHZ00_01295 [Candidatus Peribacteraceae bacterium]|nr:hypothetical protein [Candidatus Peribacteraceae bacterium]
MDADLSHLLKGLTGKERQGIRRAYRYCLDHFSSMPCRSGGTCAEHCVRVALILKEKVHNGPALRAALLHVLPDHPDGGSLPQDAPIGSERELWMISRLSSACSEEALSWPTPVSIDDPRLPMLFAAHALEQIRRMEKQDKARRRACCRRTFAHIAPMMRQLRLDDWAVEMEDRCFLEMKPFIAKRLGALAESSRNKDIVLLKHAKRLLENELASVHEPCSVEYRIKSLYGTYRKMQEHRTTWEKCHDRLALRIICTDDAACYRILDRVQRLFLPVTRLLKDHIARPKENGYQAIHAIVVSPRSPD